MALPLLLANMVKAGLISKAVEKLMGNQALPVGDTGLNVNFPYVGAVDSAQQLAEALKNMMSDEPEGPDYIVDQYGQSKTTYGEPLNPGLSDFAGLSYEYPINFREPGEYEKDEEYSKAFDTLVNMPELDAADITRADQAAHFFWGEGAPYAAGYINNPEALDAQYNPTAPTYPGGNPGSMIYKPFDPGQSGGNPFLTQANSVEMPDGYRLGGRVRMI